MSVTCDCGRQFRLQQQLAAHKKWCDGTHFPPGRRLKRTGSKWCGKCDALKPVTDFKIHRDKRGKRRHSYCDPCRRAYNRARRRKNRLCEGKGHAGGAKYFKRCPTCKREKANTAFLAGHDECRKCERPKCKCGRRVLQGLTVCKKCRDTLNGPPGVVYRQDVQCERVSLARWMEQIGATEADWSAVRKGYARYGRTQPTASEAIERHTGYATPSEQRRWGQLAHAVVLMDCELQNRKKGVPQKQNWPDKRVAA